MVRNVSSMLMVTVLALGASAAAQESTVATAEPVPAAPAPAQVPAKPASERAVPAAARNRVSLEQILTHALEHSPELGIAGARIARARAEIQADESAMPSDPMVSAGVGLRRSQGRSGIDYQVGLSQEIDLAGKRATRVRASQAGLVAEKRGLDLVRWKIHQQVHALYHRAVVARERVRASQRFVEFAERVLKVAKERLRTGETSQLPVRLAETETAQARQALLAARSEYQATRLALAQVSGWPVQRLPEPTEGLDTPRGLPPIARLIELAKRADPALRVARARTQAALLNVKAAERTAWPNPTVGVHYERESEPGGPPSHLFGGTLSFPLPLWRGAEPARLRARAAFDQTSAEAKREETLLETEVRRAAQAVEASAQRVSVFGEEIVPTSQQNLSLIERAFQLGEIDMTQVLVSRERFLRTQEASLEAYEDYYDALADLEAALGTELSPDKSHTHTSRRGGQP